MKVRDVFKYWYRQYKADAIVAWIEAVLPEILDRNVLKQDERPHYLNPTMVITKHTVTFDGEPIKVRFNRSDNTITSVEGNTLTYPS